MPDLNVDSWWKHPVGTKWVFEADFVDGNGPARRLAEFRVADDEGGRIRFEYDLFNPPDPGATASCDETWYEQSGDVFWGGEDYAPFWRVYRCGAKKGDTWSGPPGAGTAEHMGVEETSVPAGTFSAVHVRISNAQDGKTHDFWFTPREGLLRWVTRSASGSAHLSLRSYAAGAKPLEATAEATEMAAQLGLKIVQWHEGRLYARKGNVLYGIGPHDSEPRMVVWEVPPRIFSDGFAGEEFHTPREAAVHEGLTVIEESALDGEVIALDGFGRKYVLRKMGNGPMGGANGEWASDEEMAQWAPPHRPRRSTVT